MKCGALALSILCLAPVATSAASFQVFSNTVGDRYLSVTGKIGAGDNAILSAFISVLPDIKMIVLSSPGGDVVEAIKMGQEARDAHLRTMVAPKGECLSACLLAFVGGTIRTVPESSNLGSHQFRWIAEPEVHEGTRITQDLSAQVLRHFIKMGIDPEALTHIMETPPQDMFVFSEYALEKYRLITSPRQAEKKVLFDNCTGKIVKPGAEPEECSDEAYWRHVAVPNFLKAHPQYAKGTDGYKQLDSEVRRLQAESNNPFDPDLLVRAHRQLKSLQSSN